jgi:hypothetical protein
LSVSQAEPVAGVTGTATSQNGIDRPLARLDYFGVADIREVMAKISKLKKPRIVLSDGWQRDLINTMKERFPSADFLLALDRGAKANVKP